MKKYICLAILSLAIILLIGSCGVVSDISPLQSRVGTPVDDKILEDPIDDDFEPNDTPGLEAKEESAADDALIELLDSTKPEYQEGDLFLGEVHCPVHFPEYHFFPLHYSEYVGRNIFLEWLDEASKVYCDERGWPILENGCPRPKANVYEFIKHFGISKEEFHDLWYYSWAYYTEDHSPEILFGGGKELVDTYYRGDHGEHMRKMAEKVNEYNFISDLSLLYYDDPVRGEAFREVIKDGYNTFSIPQLIYEADLPRTGVEELYNRVKNASFYEINFIYDFEMIYSQKEVVMEAMKTKTPEEINNMVRSVNGVPMSE